MPEPLPKLGFRKQRKRKQREKKLHCKSVRLLCFEADGYACINKDCPDPKAGIQHHHIIPRGKQGPDTLWNSASLSPKCHEYCTKGGKGLTARQWNIKILAQHRNTVKWRWDEAFEWHISRAWRLQMPKVTVKIEGGGEVDLIGGDAQDVIDLLLGKGVDEADLKTPGASTKIGV